MPLTACPRCQSTDILPPLPLLGDSAREQAPHVEILEPEPERRPFVWMQDSQETTFTMSICGRCGYSELYAAEPGKLLAAFRKGYRPA